MGPKLGPHNGSAGRNGNVQSNILVLPPCRGHLVKVVLALADPHRIAGACWEHFLARRPDGLRSIVRSKIFSFQRAAQVERSIRLRQ